MDNINVQRISMHLIEIELDKALERVYLQIESTYNSIMKEMNNEINRRTKEFIS